MLQPHQDPPLTGGAGVLLVCADTKYTGRITQNYMVLVEIRSGVSFQLQI